MARDAWPRLSSSRLDGRGVLVTGARTGIGLAAALAEADRDVTLMARNATESIAADARIDCANGLNCLETAYIAVEMTDLRAPATWMPADSAVSMLSGPAFCTLAENGTALMLDGGRLDRAWIAQPAARPMPCSLT